MGDVKYGSITNFKAEGMLLLVSNETPLSFKSFLDEGFADRFIIFPVPAIKPGYQVGQLFDLLKKRTNNFQGIAMWALNVNQKCAEKTQRAGWLNNITTPEKSLVFCL